MYSESLSYPDISILSSQVYYKDELRRTRFQRKMKQQIFSSVKATFQLDHAGWQIFLCTGYTSACTSRVTDIPVHRLHCSLRMEGDIFLFIGHTSDCACRLTDFPVHRLHFSLHNQVKRYSRALATPQLAHAGWQMFLYIGYTSACAWRVTDVPVHRSHFSLRMQVDRFSCA